jgi:hypothetical protein
LALTASPRQISSINQEFLGSSFNREPGLCDAPAYVCVSAS